MAHSVLKKKSAQISILWLLEVCLKILREIFSLIVHSGSKLPSSLNFSLKSTQVLIIFTVTLQMWDSILFAFLLPPVHSSKKSQSHSAFFVCRKMLQEEMFRERGDVFIAVQTTLLCSTEFPPLLFFSHFPMLCLFLM